MHVIFFNHIFTNSFAFFESKIGEVVAQNQLASDLGEGQSLVIQMCLDMVMLASNEFGFFRVQQNPL